MKAFSRKEVLAILVGLVAAAGLGWWLRPEVGPARPVSPRSSQAPSVPRGTPMPRAPVPPTLVPTPAADPVTPSPPTPVANPAVPPPLTIEQIQLRLSVLEERLEVAQVRFERGKACVGDWDVDTVGGTLSLCQRLSTNIHALLRRPDFEAQRDLVVESLDTFYTMIDTMEVVLDRWEAQEDCP
jgi:hypothetical protein